MRWRVQASAVAAGSALSSSLKAASSWEASVCARRIFGPRSHPARPGLGGRGAVSIRVPSRCSGGGAEGTRRSLFFGWGGAQVSQRHAGRHGSRGSGPAPSRSLLAVAAAPWPGLRTRAFLGGGAVGPGSQPARGRAGPAPSPAHGAGSVRTAPPSFPATGPCHARRRRDLVKGLALSSFARLLRRSPCTPKLSQARLLQAPSVRVRDTGGPGSWRSVPVPSLPARPFVHRGRATHSQPSAWGRASAFLSLLSAAEPGREGPGTGPAISQAGPRGMCPFSCGEQVAPGSGPFCSLYFILKLYLMLLYERGRGGKRAVRHPYVQMSYLLCVYQR